MAARILLAAVCFVLPAVAQTNQAQSNQAQKTQAQKEWFLAAGAMIAQIDGDQLDLLGGTANSAEAAEAHRQTLLAAWEIGTRQGLLEEIQKLLRDDRDSARIGWNYPRAINLARLGYAAGFLQESEAWSLIIPAAERLQKTFSSWQELGQTYINARARWYSNYLGDRRQADYAYRILLLDQQSPWRKYPWNLDLGDGYEAPASVEKTAVLLLAAHPGGYICARITVPGHRDALEYEAAIEDAVGCHPRVTGRKRAGPDWVLDTECLQPGTLHGTQTVARFHLEAIAELLRSDGVTQLFTTFEHQPNGTDSQLFPAAHDGWISDGWQWYFDVRSLRNQLPDTVLSYGVPSEGVRVFLGGAFLFAAMSLSGAFLLQRKPGWWTTRFPLFFWGSWLVLSVSLHGLAIAGFWSGGEALEADVRGLIWYGTLALLLRWMTEIIITVAPLRAIAPDLALSRIVSMCFWRVMAEVPIATVMVLLCDPQRPINLGTVIALIGIGAAIALTAWHFRMRAEGLLGSQVSAGELHDAVWGMAKRMGVPLRRLYILPDDVSPRLGPKAGAYGDLLIPQKLLQSAFRREVDGIVAYQMMLIKIRYMNSVWAGLLPVAVILVWRIYNAQNAPSAEFTLVAQAGMVLSAFATFGKTLRSVHKRAQAAFSVSGGDAEGWIAGLARLARLSGTEVAPGVAEQIARECKVDPERLPDLLQKGFPDTGHYAVPDYDRQKLVAVS